MLQRFVVRVGYDYTMHVFREVSVIASDPDAAASEVLARSCNDPDFWADGIECDGLAGATELISVDDDVETQET